jgi:hypothetical protein
VDPDCQIVGSGVEALHFTHTSYSVPFQRNSVLSFSVVVNRRTLEE